MTDEKSDSSLVRLSTNLFKQIEHVVYAVLGIMLSVGAFLALAGAAFQVWRGMLDSDAIARTIDEHERILSAVTIRDAELARAAALAHVATTEAFLRTLLAPPNPAVKASARRTAKL